MAKNSKKYKIKNTKLTKKLSLTYFLKKRPLEFTLVFTAFVVVALYSAWATITGDMNVLARDPVPITKFTATYKGFNTSKDWNNSLAPVDYCGKTQTIYGARPAAAGDYPVLVYMHGATADWSGNKEGQRFVELAAAQGFIAVAPTYTSGGNTLDQKGLQRHAFCTFDQDHAGNGLTAICSISGVNCSKGILVAGFSQGGAISMVARNNSPLVKAVWALGVSAYIYPSKKVPTDAIAPPNGTRQLPNNKLVLNIGQASNLSTKNMIPEDLPSLKAMSGLNCGTAYNCLQADGSGYYVVQNGEIKDKVADHCYWLMVNKLTSGLSCTTNPTQLDPGFQPPATTNWSMIRNLDWLRAQI